MRRRVVTTWLAGVITALIGLAILVTPIDVPYVVQAQNVPVLRWGSSGEHVRTLQSRLAQWGYFPGTVDGVYGEDTYRAVINFQAKNGVWPADGVVGESTWSALGLLAAVRGGTQSAAASTAAVGFVDRSDHLDLLARVIAAEAEGEPFEGQVAVGAVILNRVNHPGFPNTLSGVIYQPHAFESVTNGLVWRRTPAAEAYEAARHALNGWDPTYGAVFFWNPSKPVSPWIWSRQIVVRIGSHVFAV